MTAKKKTTGMPKAGMAAKLEDHSHRLWMLEQWSFEVAELNNRISALQDSLKQTSRQVNAMGLLAFLAASAVLFRVLHVVLHG